MQFNAVWLFLGLALSGCLGGNDVASTPWVGTCSELDATTARPVFAVHAQPFPQGYENATYRMARLSGIDGRGNDAAGQQTALDTSRCAAFTVVMGGSYNIHLTLAFNATDSCDYSTSIPTDHRPSVYVDKDLRVFEAEPWEYLCIVGD